MGSPKPDVGLRSQLEMLQKQVQQQNVGILENLNYPDMITHSHSPSLWLQVEKERVEYKKRVDRMEEEADTLKTETSMLKRDLEEVLIINIILNIILIISMTILDQVKNEKSSLELQMEACKAEIKMADMERPMQQVDDPYHHGEHDRHAGARGWGGEGPADPKDWQSLRRQRLSQVWDGSGEE